MGTSLSFDGLGRYADVLLDTSFKRSFKEYGNAKRFVVEVQRAEQKDFYDRAVFNSTFAVQRQLARGADAYRFKPVYFIGIIRFSLSAEDKRYLHHYSLRDDDSGELMTDDLHYVFLDVTKCHGGEDSPFIEKVGWALGNMVSFEEKPAGLAGEFFDLLFNSADLTNFAREDKIKYLSDMTTERDIRNQIAFAREKGVEEGLERGREEGREEGKISAQKAIASNLKSQGLSSDAIAHATGLSVHEVEAL